MDLYHEVLFVHFCALIAAFAASALSHLSLKRIAAARDKAEIIAWLGYVGGIKKIFPLAILVLLASGAYMVSAAHIPMASGWLDVSLAGIVLLAVNGPIFLGGRLRRLGLALRAAADGPVDPNLARLASDPLIRAVSWINSMTALAITCLMTTKPPLSGSIAILVIAILAALALARPARRGLPGGAVDAA